MNKQVNYFIYTYSDMRLGGIQRIIYENVKLYLDKGWNVIWIAPKKYDIDKGFKSIINTDNIKIMTGDKVATFFEKQIKRDKVYICAISFDFGSFLLNSEIERNLFNIQFNNTFIVPNVLGSGVKFEENDNVKEYQLVKSVYKKMISNGNVLFCDQTQYTAFIKHYGLNNIDTTRLLVPINRNINEFDIELVNGRYLCNEIITVSRFDFPHKGYLIGLIDSFVKLKKIYSDISLRIIGYGNDENELRKKILKLDNTVSKSITIEGRVSSDRLNDYFSKAKVFVGLAGVLFDAVSTGLPSIIVRHFTYECEAYGFYQECPDKLVCDEPGKLIDDYLINIFDMNKKEYIDKSREGYEVYKKYVQSRENNTFDNKAITIKNILTEKEIEITKLIYSRYMSRRKRARNISYLKSPIYNVKRLLKRYFQ